MLILCRSVQAINPAMQLTVQLLLNFLVCCDLNVHVESILSEPDVSRLKPFQFM